MKTYFYLPLMVLYLLVPIFFFTLLPPGFIDFAVDQMDSVELADSVGDLAKDSGSLSDSFQEMEEAYDGPLPWESDERFLEMLARQRSIKLMAAYKATLKDPLPGEEFNVELAANKLAGYTIQPGRIFSQNAVLGPYSNKKGYRSGPTYAGSRVTTTIGGGVCKIASLLYNLATFSDLQIIQRHPHSMTVPYVPPGQDATVFYGVKDFVFKNNTKNIIVIWAEKVDDALYMAFYGYTTPPKVTWHHEIIKKIPTYTIYKRNKNLKRGERKVVLDGQAGIIVNSWVDIQNSDGSAKIVRRGKSFYSPCPRIIERNAL
jgi:vancomycin resistance protein YoaR